MVFFFSANVTEADLSNSRKNGILYLQDPVDRVGGPLHRHNGRLIGQECQFSDFSLILDFLRIKETGIRLISYGQILTKSQ